MRRRRRRRRGAVIDLTGADEVRAAGRQRRRRRFLRTRLAAGLLLLVVATAMPIVVLRWVRPLTTSFMLQRYFLPAAGGAACKRISYPWVAWDDISSHVPIAVVAAEDQLFFDHAGFDFRSIADAVGERRADEPVRGASTITQQVAKNLFLWPGRSWVRKALEAYATVLIELSWPKRRILEVYLNVAQFGPCSFGVAAASTELLGKRAASLTPADAALLAAVLPNPTVFRVDRPSRQVLERAAWIRRQVGRLGGPAFLQAD
jgi:monofunctional biosynthetic peptidoglycan transglycosylase